MDTGQEIVKAWLAAEGEERKQGKFAPLPDGRVLEYRLTRTGVLLTMRGETPYNRPRQGGERRASTS
jgi:hypothetical protein